MRTVLLRFVGFAVLAFVLYAGLGTLIPPASAPDLPGEQAAEALAFSFAEVESDPAAWSATEGVADHRWWTRRSFVAGETEAGRYSEQVLKVGWPFTVVRGFVRTSGTSVQPVASHPLSEVSAGPVRMLPLQPVWPGVVAMGLLGVLAMLLVDRVRSRGVAVAS
ncbi:MAG: hypothetical protein AAGI52_01860 [Bacteroidota bacterium]